VWGVGYKLRHVPRELHDHRDPRLP
jgi:hypothetical protein